MAEQRWSYPPRLSLALTWLSAWLSHASSSSSASIETASREAAAKAFVESKKDATEYCVRCCVSPLATAAVASPVPVAEDAKSPRRYPPTRKERIYL